MKSSVADHIAKSRSWETVRNRVPGRGKTGCLARQSISLGVAERLSIDTCRDRIVIHSRQLTGPIDVGASDVNSARRAVDKAVETVDS